MERRRKWGGAGKQGKYDIGRGEKQRSRKGRAGEEIRQEKGEKCEGKKGKPERENIENGRE